MKTSFDVMGHTVDMFMEKNQASYRVTINNERYGEVISVSPDADPTDVREMFTYVIEQLVKLKSPK